MSPPQPPPTTTKAVHDLDDASLGKFLLKTFSQSPENLPQIKLPVVSTKIGYGQSNPTYFVDDSSGYRMILRRKPSGRIISKVAHQVDREYRVLKALGTIKDFPVPKTYVLCEDGSVIGTAFYVMEFVKGRIYTDYSLPDMTPSDRREAWFSLVTTLARLHAIDFQSIGLEGFGKPTGMYTRHCNTYTRIEAEQARVKDQYTGIPLGRAHEHFDEIVEHIRGNPPEERTAIVHGDYKFDNVILHPTEPRVIAILDWELSTIGHPLMDAVLVTAPFWNAARSSTGPPQPGTDTNTAGKPLSEVDGVPSPDELLDHYAKITGWDPRLANGGRDWVVGQIFNHLRGCTITHGIQARTISGQASSEFSHLYFALTKSGFDQAWEMVKSSRAKDEDARAKDRMEMVALAKL